MKKEHGKNSISLLVAFTIYMQHYMNEDIFMKYLCWMIKENIKFVEPKLN
jgi:hypothetical protein